MKHILILSLLFSLSLPATSMAQERNADAQRLHKQAIEAFKANQLDDAIEWWTLAEKFDKNWKYAFNLASVLEHQKEWKTAWFATDRALRYGVPDDRVEKVKGLQKKIEIILLKTHAFIELTVEPSTAAISLNGEDWPAPHKAWVENEKSVFIVDGGIGWKLEKHEWEHAISQKQKQIIRLVKAEILTGTIAVGGAPDGSTVFIDDQNIGVFPNLSPQDYPTGRHMVRVVLEGHKDFELSVDVKKNESTAVNASMVAIVANRSDSNETNLSLATTDSSGNWMEWTLVGSGVAVIAIGAGMFVWSQSVVDEANTLNDNPTNFPAYDAKYQDLEKKHQTLSLSGWVLTGVGVATAITGGVLLWLSPELGEEGNARIEPFVGPGTGGILTTISF
jgi:hypothetical protein